MASVQVITMKLDRQKDMLRELSMDSMAFNDLAYIHSSILACTANMREKRLWDVFAGVLQSHDDVYLYHPGSGGDVLLRHQNLDVRDEERKSIKLEGGDSFQHRVTLCYIECRIWNCQKTQQTQVIEFVSTMGITNPQWVQVSDSLIQLQPERETEIDEDSIHPLKRQPKLEDQKKTPSSRQTLTDRQTIPLELHKWIYLARRCVFSERKAMSVTLCHRSQIKLCLVDLSSQQMTQNSS